LLVPAEKNDKLDITCEIWKALIYIAGIITAIAKDDKTGQEKKSLVIDETMSYLSQFSVPLPTYLLRALISQVVEFLYQMLKKKAII